MKKIWAIILSIILTSSVLLTYIYADNSEPNYLNGASTWAKNDILKATELNITYDNILNNYQQNITREEFCNLVVNLCMTSDAQFPFDYNQTPFNDTDSQMVAIAYALGIVKGISQTEFMPESNITREEIAVMLKRALDHIGYTPPIGDSTVFTDYDKISSWAVDSINAMYGCGIIRGISTTHIAPQNYTTREQAIVMVWRAYELITFPEKYPVPYEQTTPELLIELDIVDSDSWEKDTYITNIEVFEVLNKAMCLKTDDTKLADWYKGDTLASLDHLDDSTKLLLVNMCYNFRKPILDIDEIPNIPLESNTTNYEALVYITRMIGDTFGCIVGTEEMSFTEKLQTYQSAYDKTLIDNLDMDNADKPILRADFYRLLHKALFVEYYAGGYGGPNLSRYIDLHLNKGEATPPPKEEAPIINSTRIPVDITVHDDLSFSWTFPESYGFLEEEEYWSSISVTTENDSYGTTSTTPYTNISGTNVIKYIASVYPEKPTTIHCKYYKPDFTYSDDGQIREEYYVDIDISNINVVISGDEINPGTYTRFSGQWVAKEISLANGELFEKGAFYILTDYEHTYRKDEYNHTTYEVFQAQEDSNVFHAPTNRSFGVTYLDEVHIQKATLEGTYETGYTLYITPKSTDVFTIEED